MSWQATAWAVKQITGSPTRNSANNYDVVVSQTFSHTGSGFEDFTLSSQYTVPGSGTYYLAADMTDGANPNVTALVVRAYLNSDLTGTGAATTAEDSNAAFPLVTSTRRHRKI